MDDVARFWARVDRRGGPDACWPFLIHQKSARKMKPAPLNTTVLFNKKPQLAHRLAYVLTYGSIPEGRIIRHRCANCWCVNPAHLLVGTQRENVLDMYARMRAGVLPGQLFTFEDETAF